MNENENDEAIEAQIRALDKHQADITVPHRAAFKRPWRVGLVELKPGDPVWMWDHYNTGILKSYDRERDLAKITTWTAEGKEMHLTYRMTHIRPATESCVFVWPATTR